MCSFTTPITQASLAWFRNIVLSVRRWLPCAFRSSATPRKAPEDVEGDQRGSHYEKQRAPDHGQTRLWPSEASDQRGVQAQRDGCPLAQRPGAPDGDAEENEAYRVEYEGNDKDDP